MKKKKQWIVYPLIAFEEPGYIMQPYMCKLFKNKKDAKKWRDKENSEGKHFKQEIMKIKACDAG